MVPLPQHRKPRNARSRPCGDRPYAATPILAYSAGSRAMSVSTMRRSPIADNHSIKRRIGCKVAHCAAIDIVSKLAQQAKAETGTDLRQESLTNQYRGPSHLPTSDGLGMQNTTTGRGAWRGLPAIARPCIRAKSAQYPKINRAVR